MLSGFKSYRSRTDPDLRKIPDVSTRVIKFRSPLHRTRNAAITVRNLATELRNIDLSGVDVIHAHTLFPDGLACSEWLQDTSVPLVVTAHGSDVHSIALEVKNNLPPLFTRANTIIAVSGFLRDKLVALGAHPDRLHVIPNGFSADQFKGDCEVARDATKIGFLGRLSEIKRVGLLIQAMACLPPEITLDIGGDGPLMKPLRELTRSFNLQKRITFRGMISRDQVPEFLSEVSVLCLVSKREGWPTIVFESYACGTPILATAVGGLPEAVSTDELGVLVPEDVNPQQLAESINLALGRNWDRQNIRHHALDYSWDHMVEPLVEAYKKVIK
jgi:teichuronic acid biosynthesis glycosyltransferase TuaC